MPRPRHLFAWRAHKQPQGSQALDASIERLDCGLRVENGECRQQAAPDYDKLNYRYVGDQGPILHILHNLMARISQGQVTVAAPRQTDDAFKFGECTGRTATMTRITNVSCDLVLENPRMMKESQVWIEQVSSSTSLVKETKAEKAMSLG